VRISSVSGRILAVNGESEEKGRENLPYRLGGKGEDNRSCLGGGKKEGKLGGRHEGGKGPSSKRLRVLKERSRRDSRPNR